MLQQTRVAAVVERYSQFLTRFPEVGALAKAEVTDVLAMWSGLGYYRRARAMHEAARMIVAAGAIPRSEDGWRTLPGIGRYTAAAIASIAFGEACAVVDGNVERVVQRVTGNAGASIAEIWSVAERWLSRKRPGDFNQAMMELGAVVCLPAAPRCVECPLGKLCQTRGELPVKAAPKRQRARIAYALPVRRSAVYLTQRASSEKLMPGMWELPQISPNGHKPEFTLRHSITVTDYKVEVFRVNVSAKSGHWVKFDKLLSLPLTGLARKILRRAEII